MWEAVKRAPPDTRQGKLFIICRVEEVRLKVMCPELNSSELAFAKVDDA